MANKTKPGNRSHRISYRTNVVLPAVPDTVTLSVFNTQFYYTRNTSSVSMAFQHLSTSLQTSSHSETATGPEVLSVSLNATTAQDNGMLSLALAFISVRSAKCPAKNHNLLVMLSAFKELSNTRPGQFGVKD